jgi:hypothetical protein
MRLPVDWDVAVSAEERSRGQLIPESERAAHAAFRKHGCLVVRGLFAPPVIDAVFRDYGSRYGALDARAMTAQAMKPPPNPFIVRGDGRYQITPRLNDAFGTPDLLTNRLLVRLLGPLLGDDMHLSSVTLVVSHPGAALQPIHRDHGHLFAEPGVGPNLPVFAVNVVVPLIDVDLAAGPTGVWPGSHQWPSSIQPQPNTVAACGLARGDCMLVDYRTLHTGLPNQGGRVRPILYLVYARSWFFDDVNYFGTSSLDISPQDCAKFPSSSHPLLARALSQAMRNQGRKAEPTGHPAAPVRNPKDPSSWGKVGRNEPCPCDSGRKYKACHGASLSSVK